jgi:hypothetical protein
MADFPLDFAVLRKWLIYETAEDLRDQVRRYGAGPERYTLLRMAALIRKLLADREPLLPPFLSEHGLQLTYRVHEYVPSGSPPASIFQVGDHIYPGTAKTPILELTWDEFYGHRVGRFLIEDQPDITVKQLVRFAANVDGGVHLGPPERDNPAQKLLWSISPIFTEWVNDPEWVEASPAALLYPISRVILDAVKPALRILTKERNREMLAAGKDPGDSGTRFTHDAFGRPL